jgi:hypothetical protein
LILLERQKVPITGDDEVRSPADRAPEHGDVARVSKVWRLNRSRLHYEGQTANPGLDL